MRQGYRIPVAVLTVLLLASLWNSHTLSAYNRQWQERLDRAEEQAGEADWSGAAETMEEGYTDWHSRRTYLHVFARHDSVDGADALYRRCVLCLRAEDETGFLTELADLREQLNILAETERFSIGNIF